MLVSCGIFPVFLLRPSMPRWPPTAPYNPNEVAVRFSCHIHKYLYIQQISRLLTYPHLHSRWPPLCVAHSRGYKLHFAMLSDAQPHVIPLFQVCISRSRSLTNLWRTLPTLYMNVYFIFHSVVVGCVRVRKIIYKIHTWRKQFYIVWYNKCRNEKPAINGEGGTDRWVYRWVREGGGGWHHINLRANKINKRRIFGDSPVEMANNEGRGGQAGREVGHIAEGSEKRLRAGSGLEADRGTHIHTHPFGYFMHA